MSWLFSQALVAAYSEANSWDGAPSAPLSGMDTPQPFWHRDRTMELCQFSRYGLTCEPLTADRGEALLTWYLAGFPARTSVLQEMEPASMDRARGYGDTWHGSLARYDRRSRSWKTAQLSLLEVSTGSRVIFPRSGMTVDGLLWELTMSAHLTRGNGSGLSHVPTPIAGDAKSARNSTAKRKRIPPTGIHAGDTLTDYVTKYPTPVASDYRSGKVSEATMEKNSRPLREQIGGSLNPRWVEWLMGWPIGWTSLEPSAMDKCRSVWQKPGAD